MRTIIESPYGSKDPNIVQRNLRYLRRCLKDSLVKGEAPFASHMIYTQVLDDNKPDERKTGIEAGMAWGEVAELVAVYTDYGVTDGMLVGINRAKHRGIHAVYRQIGENPEHEEPCDCLHCRNRKESWDKLMEGGTK